MLGLVKTTFVA